MFPVLTGSELWKPLRQETPYATGVMSACADLAQRFACHSGCIAFLRPAIVNCDGGKGGDWVMLPGDDMTMRLCPLHP